MPLAPFGSLWNALCAPICHPGAPWMLDLGPGVTFPANMSFVSRLHTKTSFPEFAGIARVVRNARGQTPYPHAPEAKMT